MPLIISLAFIVIVSFLFSKLAEKFHFSEVIGLIIAGLILSIPDLKNSVIGGHEEFIVRLSDIGLFSLMFLAGFEVSWRMLIEERKDALAVTTLTVLTSLLFGYGVFVFLGFSVSAALIMGVCFGITAEATKARVLIQLKRMKTKIGALLMGAGIINDIIGVLSLLVIIFIFTNHISWNELSVLLGVLLSFLAGILTHYFFDRYSKKIRILEKILLIFLVPFLFVNIGLNFNLSSLIVDYKILLFVLITAASAQMIGSFLSKPITKLKFKQLFLVGWGMNSKGAVELAIALVAFQIGILPASLYSSLIILALVSSIIFQVVIFRMVKKYPGIMD